MLPDTPELVKCPFCRALLWLEELEVVGDDGRNHWDGFVPVVTPGLDPGTARPFKMPSMSDYFTLLKKGKYGLEREIYLRLRAWRAGNDRRRESEHGPGRFKRKKSPPAALTAAETANMDTLAGLLDKENEGDRLLKAELLRELGFFAYCLRLLEMPFKEEFSATAVFIRELAGKQDPWVREIKAEEESGPGLEMTDL
jgi:hypothetical protein